MNESEFERLVDAALLDGVIDAECSVCGLSIQCETDAETAWCDQCGRVVKVRNPLIEAGLI